MDITINDISLHDLAIADGNLILISQDIDTLNLELHLDSIAAIPDPLQPGEIIDLKFGDDRRFQGVMLDPVIEENSREKRLRITAESVPGRALRENVYRAIMEFVDPDITGGISIDPWNREIPILGGDISMLVSGAVSQRCEVGGIDLPVIEYPREQAANIMIWDVIRRALSYVPGSVTWFDYTGQDPEFYAAKPGSSLLTTLALSDTAIADRRIRSVVSNSVRRVRLSYVRKARIYGPTSLADIRPDDSPPREMYLRYPNDSSPVNTDYDDVMLRTIELEGAADIFNTFTREHTLSISQIFASEQRSGAPSGFHRPLLSVAHEWRMMWQRMLGYLPTTSSVDSETSFVLASTASLTVQNWESDEWSTLDPTEIHEMFANDLELTWRPARALYYTAANPELIPVLRVSIEQRLHNDPGLPVDQESSYVRASGVMLCCIRRYPRHTQITKKRYSISDPEPPYGIAESLQTSLNRPNQFEGHIVLDRESDVVAAAVGSVSGYQVGAATPVNDVIRRSFNLMGGTVRMEFGPHRHVSVQDHIRARMFTRRN